MPHTLNTSMCCKYLSHYPGDRGTLLNVIPVSIIIPDEAIYYSKVSEILKCGGSVAPPDISLKYKDFHHPSFLLHDLCG